MTQIELEARVTALVNLCIYKQLFTRQQFDQSVQWAEIRIIQERERNPPEPSILAMFGLPTNGA